MSAAGARELIDLGTKFLHMHATTIELQAVRACMIAWYHKCLCRRSIESQPVRTIPARPVKTTAKSLQLGHCEEVWLLPLAARACMPVARTMLDNLNEKTYGCLVTLSSW